MHWNIEACVEKHFFFCAAQSDLETWDQKHSGGWLKKGRDEAMHPRPTPPPGLPAQLAQLISPFCWWGKPAAAHCSTQSRESRLLVSEWVSQWTHYGSIWVSHADSASVCVCGPIPLRLEPPQSSQCQTPEPIRLHLKKINKFPRATYSNVINSQAKLRYERSLSGFTYWDLKKKKWTGERPRPKSLSYGLWNPRQSRERLHSKTFLPRTQGAERNFFVSKCWTQSAPKTGK